MKFRASKRALAVLLSLVMLLGLFPTAFAADADNQWSSGVFAHFMTDQYTLSVNDTTSIEATVIGDGQLTYQWTSSNPAVVQVSGSDNSASLTALAAGTVAITLRVTRPSDGDYDIAVAHVTVQEPQTQPVTARGSGSSSLSLTASENQTLSVAAGGGSGSYTYRWESDGSVGVDTTKSGASNVVYALRAGTGDVTVTVSDAADPSNYAVVTWNVTVKEDTTPVTAQLNKTQMELTPGKSDTLSITASGGSGSASNYEYYWQSDNPGVATLSVSGSTATVTAASSVGVNGGTAEIRATVYDKVTKTSSDILYCNVVVKNNQTTYNTSASATVGSDLSMDVTARSVADQFADKFGSSLNYSASVRFSAPSGAAGMLTFPDGARVTANASYTFASFQDMLFKPTAAGTFTTGYTITDGGNIISGNITVQVAGGAAITSANLNPSTMRMAPYSNQYLNLNVTPAHASYTVSWSSSDTKLVTVAGSGSLVNVVSQGRTGTANVVATIQDSSGAVITRSIPVTVYTDSDSGSSSTRTYNPSLTVTMGSDYYGTSVSDSIAKQWRSYFGVALADSAKVVFNSTGNTRYGVLRLNNGAQVKASTNYTFPDLENMYFEPYAAGNFTIPYTITYRGDTMSGTITITVRATSLSVTINTTSVNLSPYSNQYLTLGITPSTAYYRVAWSTSNASIATVSGNGASATVSTQGKAGTATITATITDANNTKIYRTCSVKVSGNAASSYDPTVTTTLGVNYTGTGTADSMASQFHNLFGVNLDANKATIRFSSVGDSKLGVMHLVNGTAAKANTNYTFAQYKTMYLEPVSAGTYRVPYTLTYNGMTLSGTANFVINTGNVNCALVLPDTLPYVFSKALAGGTGGAQLSGAIRNAVGSSWTFVRFTGTSGTVGNLYLNDRSAALGSGTNITAQAMNQLYFVPARPGTFSASFTVYNNNGKLADGSLKILVPGSAAASFVDVPANAYYANAVTWALQNEVTTGTSATTFSPGNAVTRAQAVTFLWRAMGKPSVGNATNPFRDVGANEYYTQAVLWAVRQGITTGTSATTFSPNSTLVQDQMLTFLCRATGANADGANWSDLAMRWAQERGLFAGRPSIAGAKDACPRSDVVYYLWKNAN